MEDKGTTGVGELLVLSPASVACLLACVFFHLSFWGCDSLVLGFKSPLSPLPPPHTHTQGEAIILGWGGPHHENGVVVSCSHLLKASSGVRGSGNQRK